MNKKKKYAIILILEIIALVVMLVLAYGVIQYTKMDKTELDIDELEVYADTGNYTNIALFGLDSRKGELEDGVRSDCIMIASINNETHEVRIVSVYRDTLLLQQDNSYEKANAAYSFGGPQEAIALLNRNFDLDIVKYVSVNFNALSDVIDALGGIDIEMTEEEVGYTNDYVDHTAKVVGGKKTKLSGSGVMHCNGVQAVSFTRIRYTEGYDFKRTHRQRIVLEKVIEKAKNAKYTTLAKVVNKVFPQISTNLSLSNILALAAHATEYDVSKMSGFPFDMSTSDQVMYHEGSYVVPIGLAENVSKLHEYLFDVKDYVPSEAVQSISNEIIYMTGIAPDTGTERLDYSYASEGGEMISSEQDSSAGAEEETTDTVYQEEYYPQETYQQETYQQETYQQEEYYPQDTYQEQSYEENYYQEEYYQENYSDDVYYGDVYQ